MPPAPRHRRSRSARGLHRNCAANSTAAACVPPSRIRDAPLGWRVNSWVKRGILLGFRIGQLAAFGNHDLSFVDKSTFPARSFTPEEGIRIVVGGSSVREGAYLARGVICVPPMYVNVGAYVDEGTLVDSHALVGSCAQIGKRVHLSAAAQVGGVLEPVNANPVIIEDDVLVGGNCGVYEGTIVRKGAVLAAGTVLTRGTPVYDIVNGVIHKAEPSGPARIRPQRPNRWSSPPVPSSFRAHGQSRAAALPNGD